MRHTRAIILLLFSFFVFTASSMAQSKKYSINGYIKDSSTREDLIGAAIYIKSLQEGTTTNSYGYFSLQVPEGEYLVRASYGGYKNQLIKIKVDKNITQNFYLGVKEVRVEVKGQGARSQVEETQMGKVDLPISKIKELPAIFGEVDVLKTIQLLPGVQTGSEGSAGFYVRGGGSDENLIILDEAIVYNASHLFGFFSVFNSDAIRNVELYKGGFPARFGGRLSSVIDISLKDGNKNKFAVTGGIGLIASRLTIEGPIIKDKCSFIISSRRTYFDIFTRAYNKSKASDPEYNPIPDYYFYDLNAKINYTLGAKDRLYLSGYFGKDVFGFSRGAFGFNFNWGNSTGTARWNHIFSPKLFMNTTATYTDYNYSIGNTASNIGHFSIGSAIQDWAYKSDFEYNGLSKHNIRFGAAYIYHTFDVARSSFQTTDNSFNLSQDKKLFGSEMGAYISDDWDIDSSWRLNYGLRYSGYLYKNKTTQTDANPGYGLYSGAEPRVALRYKINKTTALKASYTDMKQYVHLVTNSGSTLPTDVWYPSNATVKPENCQQVAAGLTKLLFDETVTFSDEVYYKWVNHVIDYSDTANVFLNPNLDAEYVYGKGWSYGNEFFLQKTEGSFTGWIAYTLAWSFRQFPALNGGEVMHPKYDQRHNLSLVGTYELSKRLTLSATFVYGSGTLTTLPVAYQYVNDINGTSSKITPVVENRNNVRMPYTSRLDIALVWKFNPRWGKSDLTFSVYNALNRRNPYVLYIDQQLVTTPGALQLPVQNTAKQISLFPIIPSVTYNFKF